METFSDEFVQQIYDLPKTPQAVSDFLNSYYDEEQPDGSIKRRQVWEKFEGAFVGATHHYNQDTDDSDAAVYIYAHKLVSKCVLDEVAPYFESDGQFFSYFQIMVMNSRRNDAAKEQSRKFELIGDMLDEEHCTEMDYVNFESQVLGSREVQPFESGGINSILESIDELGDPQLIMFGRLFVTNDFSFDGMYGMCGLDLQTFRAVKKRFIAEMRKKYSNR